MVPVAKHRIPLNSGDTNCVPHPPPNVGPGSHVRIFKNRSKHFSFYPTLSGGRGWVQKRVPPIPKKFRVLFYMYTGTESSIAPTVQFILSPTAVVGQNKLDSAWYYFWYFCYSFLIFFDIFLIFFVYFSKRKCPLFIGHLHPPRGPVPTADGKRYQQTRLTFTCEGPCEYSTDDLRCSCPLFICNLNSFLNGQRSTALK